MTIASNPSSDRGSGGRPLFSDTPRRVAPDSGAGARPNEEIQPSEPIDEVDVVDQADADAVDAAFAAADARVKRGSDDLPGASAGPGGGTVVDDDPSLESELESTLVTLESVTAERDEYLDLARRVQAEFENYKRRVSAQREDEAGRQAESLVGELLPVLDACEAALSHGVEEVAPIQSMLEGTLAKLGLTKVHESGAPFDPNVHEAVLSEPGDDDAEPSVAEVLRTGYSWKGRVLRPAMVKVRG